MWQTMMKFLPGVGNWRIDFGTFTDLVGLVLGSIVLAFTVWVARRQIQIMKQQTTMMQEQSEGTKRQEEISKRQGEIVETQHRIMQEQLARRAVIHMSITQGTPIAGGRTLCRIYVHNNGNRSISSYNWELVIPAHFAEYLNIRLPPETHLEEELQAVAGEVCKIYRSFREEPVWPRVQNELGTIDFKELPPERGNLIFWWKVFCEDGPFPNEKDWGHLSVRLYQ